MNIELLEAFMLICWGASWPFSIAKLLQTRSVEGKSTLFLILIFCGYVAAITAQFFRGLTPVIFLYILNATMVFTDLCLVLKYRHVEPSKCLRWKHGTDYSPNDPWVVTLRPFKL